MNVHFTVFGTPQPQGSLRAFIPKGWTRPVLTSSNKSLRSWRQEVASAAVVAMSRDRRAESWRPVTLKALFYFDRPRSLSKRITEKSTRPDLDKLVRALGDALAGICYERDSQINRIVAQKEYGSPARTEVTITA